MELIVDVDGFVLNDLTAQQNVAVQLRLAWAVATDRVDMHAVADHIVGQYGGELLVGGAGRDDHPVRDRIIIRRISRG